EPEYNEAILSTNKVTVGDQKTDDLGGDDEDPLLWEAADLVVSNNFASTSTIQRKLSVGYARAGRIMDQLEDKGIVGPRNGSKPREVIVTVEELEAIKAFDTLD
ncbi:MAG: DNA translocase FtsK, partial [Eggerthellaceae bacterium]|nr:DNA translocase FtsK [Eggerthellaceae bacterium]